MPILNYTTKVDAYKTLMEIQQLLSKQGAKKVIIDNDDNGQPVALSFHLDWRGQLTAFSLPCNFEGVLKAMKKGKVPRTYQNQAQALKVGWRIIKTWIEAQMAIIEAEVATMAEVFLPYAVTKEGTTLYKQFDEKPNSILLLTQFANSK